MKQKAEKFLNTALGGNMNLATLKPLALIEIMTAFAEIEVAAINYTRCCTELRDKETPKIEDWLKDNFKRLDRHSFTNTHEDTVWLRSELVEVYNQLHP
mgnify:CR=1 FL=1